MSSVLRHGERLDWIREIVRGQFVRRGKSPSP